MNATIQFTGADGLYERHLLFDNVQDSAGTSQREHFEAVARSIRDVLSQRWIDTEWTYQQRESQADLLSFDGVPDRPFARLTTSRTFCWIRW